LLPVRPPPSVARTLAKRRRGVEGTGVSAGSPLRNTRDLVPARACCAWPSGSSRLLHDFLVMTSVLADWFVADGVPASDRKQPDTADATHLSLLPAARTWNCRGI